MAFTNRNVCKNFQLNINTNLQCLANQECSEVVVLSNKHVHYYDYKNPTVNFIVPANTEFTFRGLTNANQLSALGQTSGTLYYRTQFFSFFPEVR